MAFYKSRRRFEVESDGFHGVYWENPEPTRDALIVMLGDDAEDHMARSGVKWAMRLGVNVMSMSSGRGSYDYVNYPLERVGAAVDWMRAQGNDRFGIAGASTTGTLALASAATFPELTLTLAFTPSDFVWQGFEQGKRDGCGEWPVEGASLFSLGGKPLPCMRFVYQHPEYWQVMQAEAKRTKSMVSSRKVFDDSEARLGIPEAAFIPVENIKGRLVLVAAADDVLWDCVRYARRAEARIASRPHDCEVEVLAYEHGTHFVFPESLMRTMLPAGVDLVLGLCFGDARGHAAECRATRRDIDARVRAAVAAWRRR